MVQLPEKCCKQRDLNINEPGSLDELDGQDEILSDQKGTDSIETLTVDGLNLAPGESETVNLDFASQESRTASVVAPGAYYLLAEADPNNAISEDNEDNNVASQFISTDGTDVVVDWNSTFLNAVQTSGADTYGYSDNEAGTIPPVVPRNGAVLQTAVYDAVNAFEEEFEPYSVDDEPPEGASAEAAAVGAAYTALSELYPGQQASFNAQRDRSLAEIGKTQEGEGFQFGADVAEQILESGTTDSAISPSNEYEPDNELGTWKAIIDGENQTPVGPQFESVPPFEIPSVQQFRPDGPPQFGSPKFAEETEETRMVGGLQSSTDDTEITRTEEQTKIAQFWSQDRTDTFRPPGQWNQIAQNLVL